MKGLSSLQSLLFELEKLPGVGPRSALRLAQHLLKSSAKDITQLSRSLLDVKNQIRKCPQCFCFTERENLCALCEDTSRNPELLCVVEEAFDVFRIEKSGLFKGSYHVLQGVLSPLNNKHPEDLTLKELEKRIKTQKIKELILAVDSDLEGDTTALYIMQNFKSVDLKISRLAQGIPVGSDLAFVDDKTLGQALENRGTF